MRNVNYFIELHNNVNRLEKDFENFEILLNAHDRLFERFFDFDKAVHSCESEDMNIFALLKDVISYEFERLSNSHEKLKLIYDRSVITDEEEIYFKKVQDISDKISAKKELLKKAILF